MPNAPWTVEPTTTVVAVSISPQQKKRLDSMARKGKMTRSRLLRQLLDRIFADLDAQSSAA